MSDEEFEDLIFGPPDQWLAMPTADQTSDMWLINTLVLFNQIADTRAYLNEIRTQLDRFEGEA